MSPSLGSRTSFFCAFRSVPTKEREYTKRAWRKRQGVHCGTRNARRLNALPVERIKRQREELRALFVVLPSLIWFHRRVQTRVPRWCTEPAVVVDAAHDPSVTCSSALDPVIARRHRRPTVPCVCFTRALANDASCESVTHATLSHR